MTPIYTARLLVDHKYRQGWSDGAESVLRELQDSSHSAINDLIFLCNQWARTAPAHDTTPPEIKLHVEGKPVEVGMCRECKTRKAVTCDDCCNECCHCDAGVRPESCEACSGKHKLPGGDLPKAADAAQAR